MNWFRFAVTVSISVLSVAATHVSADKSWQRSSVELVQTKLNDLGYTAGPVDGAWGRKTSSALTLYCEEYDHDCSGGEETVIDLLTADTDDSHLDVEMDFASAVWFENRIGYGAPKDRVDRYVGMTRREAVALVIKELRTYSDVFLMPHWFEGMKPVGKIIDTETGASCMTGYMKSSLQSAWLEAVYTSEVPQFDRISTLFLDHFAVGYDAYIHPHMYAKHLQFVRNWRETSFENLLYGSLQNPATIVYLNNDKSDRKTPNENLAREFFELFALGEGNYSEQDVREFSKLLTGNAFNTAEENFEYMPERALNTSSRIFGKNYSSSKKFVSELVEHPAYGEYLINKFYNEFVSLEKPTIRKLRRYQFNFVKNGSDLVSLFEKIISDEDFWKLNKQLTLIKSPLDLFSGTARTFNFTGSTPANFSYWLKTSDLLNSLDQAIFDPPSVDGWPNGREWLQGQALDRRAVSLSKNFPQFVDKSFFAPPVSESTARKYWRDLKYNQTRSIALKDFFGSASKNQVLIEGIAVQAWDFKPKQYYVLTVLFKNVSLNGKIYDQITLYFNNAVTNTGAWRRHIKLYKETTSDGFLKNALWKSDGDTVWFGTPLPLSIKDQNFKSLSGHEKRLLKGLVKASSVIVTDPVYKRWVDLGGIAWIESIIKEHGEFVDLFDPISSTRLFEPPPHPDDKFKSYPQAFNCNYQLGLEERYIDSYFKYNKIKAALNNPVEVDSALQKNYYDHTKLKVFAENLGKLWMKKEVLSENDRPIYLAPDSEQTDWRAILQSVEYNFR